ncbi:uncharacterized protein EI90DRAFT_2057960 [Cantharellus anzutake]|uniref:uncharacterized protein n=1 Tax=Cantharellus anzutake TaxID=1750568 RepID=UPI0019035535|nr:uncharacterized protein EI90DRAFT_2057960 [Cantharellus anzutake]KAF8340390.1 hypothetical protein EI90DRAFT_2057960 [Cantharellus anzutake]
MRRHISTKDNKVLTFERYYQKHAWRPSCEQRSEETPSTSSRSTVPGSGSAVEDTTWDKGSKASEIDSAPSSPAPTSALTADSGEHSSTESSDTPQSENYSHSPAPSFLSASSSDQSAHPADSARPPHSVIVVGHDFPTDDEISQGAVLHGQGVFQDPDLDGLFMTPKSPEPLISSNKPALMQENGADYNTEPEQWHMWEFIHDPDDSTAVNGGAMENRAYTETPELFDSASQLLSGFTVDVDVSVRDWVQRVPAWDTPCEPQHGQPAVFDGHGDATQSHVQTSRAQFPSPPSYYADHLLDIPQTALAIGQQTKTSQHQRLDHSPAQIVNDRASFRAPFFVPA